MPEWSTIAGIVASLAAVLTPTLLYRTNRRQQTVDQPQKIIDQVQEERAADRASFKEERDHLHMQQQRAFDRIEGLETQNRLLWDYVLQMRYYMAKGSQGIPPTLPEGLLAQRPK